MAAHPNPMDPVQEFHAGTTVVLLLDAEDNVWLKVKDTIHPLPYPNLFVQGSIRMWKAKNNKEKR